MNGDAQILRDRCYDRSEIGSRLATHTSYDVSDVISGKNILDIVGDIVPGRAKCLWNEDPLFDIEGLISLFIRCYGNDIH